MPTTRQLEVERVVQIVEPRRTQTERAERPVPEAASTGGVFPVSCLGHRQSIATQKIHIPWSARRSGVSRVLVVVV